MRPSSLRNLKVKFLIKEVTNRLRLLWVSSKEDYLTIQEQLGFTPYNIEYYTLALSHKSVLTKKGQDSQSNERLEYLGDAVIETIVSDILYKQYKKANEGQLTNMRVKLVQRETLNRVANKMGLEKIIKTSNMNKTHNFNVYGNAFEALMGAIYLDRGFDFTYYYLKDVVLKKYMDMSAEINNDHDYKSKLIEWCQKYHVPIEYSVVNESKDKEHNIIFKTEVLLNGIHGGMGTGYSKKESQQKASQAALKKISADRNFFRKNKKEKEAKAAQEGNTANNSNQQ